MNLPFLKSTPGAEPVRVEAFFACSADRLFRAWTEPHQIKAWFGPGPARPASALVDLRVGGLWEVVFVEQDGQVDRLSGAYLDIAPAERLVFTWVHERRLPGGQTSTTAQSLVTVEFRAETGGVRLLLAHEQIVTASGREGVGFGWNAGFERLGRLVGGAGDDEVGQIRPGAS